MERGLMTTKLDLMISRGDAHVALRRLDNTQDLALSPDSLRVRRLVPMPNYDIADMQKRILVVESLPATPTIGMRNRHELHSCADVASLCRDGDRCLFSVRDRQGGPHLPRQQGQATQLAHGQITARDLSELLVHV